MGTIDYDLPEHHGYADRRMSDGTYTTGDRSERFLGDGHVAFVAACSCGWRATTEHPPTDAGEQAAKRQWNDEHASPIVGRVPPTDLLADIDTLRRRLTELVDERPLAALAALRGVSDWATTQTRRGAGRARDTGSTWREIAEQLGVTAQAAQQRYTTALTDRDAY